MINDGTNLGINKRPIKKGVDELAF
jgi:hypothetical protein